MSKYPTTESGSQRHLLNRNDILTDLLAGDLSFQTPNQQTHPLHALHPFAARFPYGLPGHFIGGLTEPGDTVLDPMCGSGITLLEGWLSGRSVIGIDLDPLACRQSAARTTAFGREPINSAGDGVLIRAGHHYSSGDPLVAIRDEMDDATQGFLDYWFFPETQRELAALVLAIREEPDSDLRNLLEVVFSSVIVTKSGGVSRARDLAHTRAHRVMDKTPGRALPIYAALLDRAAAAYDRLDAALLGDASVTLGDSRALPLSDESVDLIVTSPPYINALDYMRAHKFSLAWLGYAIPDLSNLRSKYIGSEAAGDWVVGELPASIETVVNELNAVAVDTARMVRRYFAEMNIATQEMFRVLRPGRAVVAVVGPSVLRGVLVPTYQCLADLAAQVGFEVVAMSPRNLDRDRRVLPARNASHRVAVIERRMYTEHIIGMVKP